MQLNEALKEAKTQLEKGPAEWQRLDLALDFEVVFALVAGIDAAEIGARETVMALDGLEGSWNYSKYNGYGKGVSGWDGPALLKRFLASLKAGNSE